MDILLEVAAPEPRLLGDLCPAGVDLCGERGHGLPLSRADELDGCCCECGGTGTPEGHRGCQCRDAAQNGEGELERCVLQLKERSWNHPLIKEASQSATQHIQSQAVQTEAQIKEEFEKLRQFLRREEEARIAMVREEEERKRKRAKEESEKLDKLIQELADTVKDLETELDRDEISFLQKLNIKPI
ncbi:E3 ubiquitin-protein ligase TRIM35-like [Sardina pilchardus]|uniref:E3 ubiquitin-protein ligase TRIM35-like n=1 Tax=Sardina pilchardus TaxID=27697 RepID=UPI002E0EC46D